jgi:hypothetical protein
MQLNAYAGCPRRNVPDFGRVFLMLKYADITQNTYVQSRMQYCALLNTIHSIHKNFEISQIWFPFI